jgi:hypothetical protein
LLFLFPIIASACYNAALLSDQVTDSRRKCQP